MREGPSNVPMGESSKKIKQKKSSQPQNFQDNEWSEQAIIDNNKTDITKNYENNKVIPSTSCAQ
jgi:hypothetical protein